MICKVATSETCHPSEISTVEELLKTDLSLFNPHGGKPKKLAYILIRLRKDILNECMINFLNLFLVDSSILPVVTSKPIFPTSSEEITKWKEKKESGSPSKASDTSDWEDSGKPKPKRRLSSTKARRRSSSPSSSSRSSSSRSSSSRSRSRSRSKCKRARSTSHDNPKENL